MKSPCINSLVIRSQIQFLAAKTTSPAIAQVSAQMTFPCCHISHATWTNPGSLTSTARSTSYIANVSTVPSPPPFSHPFRKTGTSGAFDPSCCTFEYGDRVPVPAFDACDRSELNETALRMLAAKGCRVSVTRKCKEGRLVAMREMPASSIPQ